MGYYVKGENGKVYDVCEVEEVKREDLVTEVERAKAKLDEATKELESYDLLNKVSTEAPAEPVNEVLVPVVEAEQLQPAPVPQAEEAVATEVPQPATTENIITMEAPAEPTPEVLPTTLNIQ